MGSIARMDPKLPSISGSGSAPVSKNFAGFVPDFSSKNVFLKSLNAYCIVFDQF